MPGLLERERERGATGVCCKRERMDISEDFILFSVCNCLCWYIDGWKQQMHFVFEYKRTQEKVSFTSFEREKERVCVCVR